MITRREFTIATSSSIVLKVLGCDVSSGQAQLYDAENDGPVELSKVEGKKRHASKLAKAPFLIGSANRYVVTGVYVDFEAKGVWLVSNGQTLVALNSTCTHLGCATQMDSAKAQFACPCHKSRFDMEGNLLAGGKAKRPLERCAMRLVEDQIEVDPTRRFRKEKGEWIDPASSFELA